MVLPKVSASERVRVVMDIYCGICGEPWNVDSLHDAVNEGRARDRKDARWKFELRGCGMWGVKCADKPDTPRAMASAALMEVMGDDLDGVASMLEDAEHFGMFS
jgi:hypothetical protein